MEIVVKNCKLKPIIIARHIVKKCILASQSSAVINIINYALLCISINNYIHACKQIEYSIPYNNYMYVHLNSFRLY